MANKLDDKKGAREDEAEFENVPSDLDEITHAEMRLLYDESEQSIRFAKHHQWWVVGSTLLLFGGLIIIAHITSPDIGLGVQMSWLIILASCSGIFLLVLYQFWQFNEASKMNYISKQFSSLFREVRAIKSSMEANVHRYIFLSFMITTIILGAIVSNIVVIKIMESY